MTKLHKLDFSFQELNDFSHLSQANWLHKINGAFSPLHFRHISTRRPASRLTSSPRFQSKHGPSRKQTRLVLPEFPSSLTLPDAQSRHQDKVESELEEKERKTTCETDPESFSRQTRQRKRRGRTEKVGTGRIRGSCLRPLEGHLPTGHVPAIRPFDVDNHAPVDEERARPTQPSSAPALRNLLAKALDDCYRIEPDRKHFRRERGVL